MQFRKYEFNTSASWLKVKSTLETMMISNPGLCSIVELGNIVITPGTYDNQGNEITAPVLSTKTAVDILWNEDTIPSEFTQYEVWPKEIGSHTFLGLDHLYTEEYNKRKQQ